MKKLLLILVILFSRLSSLAQDSSLTDKQFTKTGYIKDLQSLSFDKDFSEGISGNIIHNRLNFKWKPSGTVMAAAEFRTRLFWGEEMKQVPDFTSLLNSKNEWFNLEKVWIENKSLILISNTERLYADFRKENINLRIGRQRINWGVTTTWNPNDIFNSYNFLDFDYEERPGVDAAKISYYFKNSNLELGHAMFRRGSYVSALKYSFSKWNYDIQLIAGSFHNNLTFGGGWAGSIMGAGFKGEAQYFFEKDAASGRISLSAETDYMFNHGLYINAAFLFNSQGISGTVNNPNDLNFKLSPQNIMPTKWNMLLTTAKEITPLFSANVSSLYSPGTRMLIVYPSLQYSLASNIDLNLVWQSFFAELGNTFEAVDHRFFLRLKASF